MSLPIDIHGAPRQAIVIKFIQQNPGSTLNDVFHGLRACENGISYEMVRGAATKLLAKGLIRKAGQSALYKCQLFVTELFA